MKRIKLYLIKISIALLAFIIGIAVYLFAPPFSSSIKDIPPEQPIALVPSKENKGKRCEANTLYVSENLGYSDIEIIDAYCAKMQTGLLDAIGADDIERVRLLLAQGANPNSAGFPTQGNGDAYQPLPRAYSNSEFVNLLLNNGANLKSGHILFFCVFAAFAARCRLRRAVRFFLILMRL